MHLIRQHLWIVTAVGFCLCLAPASAGAQGLSLAQPNVARFSEVTLYAAPLDTQGRRIPGLGVGDFAIQEDGTSVSQLSVESNRSQLDVALSLDCSRSMVEGGKSQAARAAALEFLRRMGPQDRISVILFGESVQVSQPLTQSSRSVAASIVGAEPTGMGTAFRDSLLMAVRQLAIQSDGVVQQGGGRADARRVVVALTDGLDNSSVTDLDTVVRAARSYGVSLVLVAVGRDAVLDDLRFLARETGGAVVEAPASGDLTRLYAGIAASLQSEYRLRYTSPRPHRDSTRRTVLVSLPRQRLSATTSYQAPGPGSLVATVPNPNEVGPEATAFGEARKRMGLAVLGGVTAFAVVLGALIFRFGGRRSVQGRGGATELWVRLGATTVGRDANCDLVLSSREVSRCHAVLETSAGRTEVVDLDSHNGVFVNGRRIKKRRELQAGDRLRFGDVEFAFAGVADPAENGEPADF